MKLEKILKKSNNRVWSAKMSGYRRCTLTNLVVDLSSPKHSSLRKLLDV